MRRLSRAACPLLVLLVGLSVGCGRIRQNQECNQVAERVNGAFEEIEALRRRGEKPETYTAIAARYEKLAKDLEQVKPTKPGVQRALAEYRNMLFQTSSSLKRAAPHVADPDGGALRRDRVALDGLLRQERTLVQRFEAACRAP